jgi:hypothetical protein
MNPYIVTRAHHGVQEQISENAAKTFQVTFSRMCIYTPPRHQKPVDWSARGLDDIQIDCQVTFICKRKSLVDGLDELEVTITRSPLQEQRDALWHIMTIDEQQECLYNMKYTKTWSNVKAVTFSVGRNICPFQFLVDTQHDQNSANYTSSPVPGWAAWPMSIFENSRSVFEQSLSLRYACASLTRKFYV